MEGTDIIIKKIDQAVEQINHYKSKYSPSETAFTGTFIVLDSIKSELIEYSTIVNERLLRGFKDVCTNMVRNFEGENFETTIFEIADYFSEAFPSYDSLDLLREDFGLGFPV